ncbi:MAG: hypothetical protein JW914_08580 [Syntrophaceae bacterium]|nr:hypothetical protein [Syntrophaceae bacterium]
MLNIFQFFTKPTQLKDIPLKPYLIEFSLNRLALGIDNIRIDVHISPQLQKSLQKTAFFIVIKHSQTEHFFREYSKKNCRSEKDALKIICADALRDGINRAKAEDEIQIDYLGQAALAKLFREEVKNQYKKLLAHFEPLGLSYELSRRHTEAEFRKVRDKLATIKLTKNRIIQMAGAELFQIITDIQTDSLRNMREINFQAEQILPSIFFNNPILHTDNPADDFFLIEEYVLMGQRSKDPDNYNNVKAIIYNLLEKTDLRQRHKKEIGSPDKNKRANGQFSADDTGHDFDALIMEPENIDRMMNVFDSRKQYKNAKREKKSKVILLKIKERIKIQRSLLNLFYRKFKKAGLLDQIVASFEMKNVYGIYCPPIAPCKIKEFLTDFWARKFITYQLKSRKTAHGAAFKIAPLKKTVSIIKGLSVADKKAHLLNFLRQFSRYHRDLYNFRLLKDAMELINFVNSEKNILLSRGNRSLYEFLLPSERVKKEKPVSNHVIIKADIRGSMKINNIMRSRGLNPASLFSLNFFDPISAIILDYDASKVFIEGDAIILSIFENQDAPEGWYSVARACGLAIRILQIVQGYNMKNKENNLPLLEIGIGISHSPSAPTYLFDGDSRIMISPAINKADRLSECNKRMRKFLSDHDPLFNLFVFKNVLRSENDEDDDDLYMRYNVNGIELDSNGFNKLSKEITLHPITYSSAKNKKMKLYSGKVPTLNGNYQPIVIREDIITEIHPEKFETLGNTFNKYYEVCTHRQIYEFAENKVE